VTSLKDLVDMGYKILDLEEDRPSLIKIFNDENITSHSLESSLVDPAYISNTSSFPSFMRSSLAANNITLPFEVDRHISRYDMYGHLCYFASQTVMIRSNRYFFIGLYAWRFYKAIGLLRESGILEMYKTFRQFLSYYVDIVHEYQLRYLESQPVAFTMSDEKVSSIFSVWVSLLGLAGFVFITEYSQKKIIKNLYSVKSAVRVSGTYFVNNLRIISNSIQECIESVII
jgi:hypothetical protein